jgi:hypothetical protein
MPRFYFHSRTGTEYLPDERGLEFENLSQAREEAIRAIREMMGETMAHSEALPSFEIADHTANVVDSVTSAQALSDSPELLAELSKRTGFLSS